MLLHFNRLYLLIFSLFLHLYRLLTLVYHIDVFELFYLTCQLATFLAFGTDSERLLIRVHAGVPLYLLLPNVLILATLVELLPNFISFPIDSLND